VLLAFPLNYVERYFLFFIPQQPTNDCHTDIEELKNCFQIELANEAEVDIDA
jgi:hypothetical protein